MPTMLCKYLRSVFQHTKKIGLKKKTVRRTAVLVELDSDKKCRYTFAGKAVR